MSTKHASHLGLQQRGFTLPIIIIPYRKVKRLMSAVLVTILSVPRLLEQRRAEARAKVQADKDAASVKAPVAAPTEAAPSTPKIANETLHQDSEREEVTGASRAGGVKRVEVDVPARPDAPDQSPSSPKPAAVPSPPRAPSPPPIIVLGYHPPGVRHIWGGTGAGTAAGFSLGGGGSAGGVGGGLSPAGSQHPSHSPQAPSPVLQPRPPTQLQQQQQHVFYGSFAGGAATPRPHQQGSGIVAPSQLANPMLLHPPLSQGMRFGAGGMSMGLGMRGGVLPGTEHGMLGRLPPPQVMIANQQMQSPPQQLQQHQQQQQVGRANLYMRDGLPLGNRKAFFANF